MSYGLERAGFVVAAGIDSDAYACETHAANLLSHTVRTDIRTIADPHALLDELAIPRVDLIVGGPPCQGFSLAGQAKVRSLSKGFRDEIYARNYLYREFVRFVEALQPSFFVMENVPQLSSFADGVIGKLIASDFEAIGYHVYREVLDASRFGVPQARRRLFFVGSRIGRVYRPPRETHGRVLPVRTLADAISDLPAVFAPALDEVLEYVPRARAEFRADPTYRDLMRSGLPAGELDRLYDHVVRPVREDDAHIFRTMRPGDRYRDVDPAYRRYELKAAEKDGDYHFADRYYKLRWEDPCITITAHMAKDGYRYIYPDPDQPRTLSVREAARIQSFPDHFRFAGYRTNRFQQIGNAVPPLLAEAIGRSLGRALRDRQAGLAAEHEWQPRLPELLPLEEAVPAALPRR